MLVGQGAVGQFGGKMAWQFCFVGQVLLADLLLSPWLVYDVLMLLIMIMIMIMKIANDNDQFTNEDNYFNVFYLFVLVIIWI